MHTKTNLMKFEEPPAGGVQRPAHMQTLRIYMCVFTNVSGYVCVHVRSSSFSPLPFSPPLNPLLLLSPFPAILAPCTIRNTKKSHFLGFLRAPVPDERRTAVPSCPWKHNGSHFCDPEHVPLRVSRRPSPERGLSRHLARSERSFLDVSIVSTVSAHVDT